VTKGDNHFTILGTDPQTARDSAPLRVIASVDVLGTEVAPGELGAVLPEGVAIRMPRLSVPSLPVVRLWD
jgi:hypothetical protein